jgi:4-hydroxy-tetrahydrodipicolinate reductase
MISKREELSLVAGVDIDPNKIGLDVGQVIGLDSHLGFTVRKNLERALMQTEANIVVHTTSSYFDLFKGQILEILGADLDVVSTSEELVYPWNAHPEEAAEIDAAARHAGKTVLGTGVNPGYIMDALPLNLTSICDRVNRIEVTRIINASTRRGPFQAKIGSGMSLADFQERMDAGRMGHVGLPESVDMIFDTLGVEMVRYVTAVEPIVADQIIKTPYFEVHPGQVKGLKQVAQGFSNDGEFLTLTFIAALDAQDEADTIRITGVPDLEVTLKGTNGDIATAAIAVNAIRRVVESAPGLVTMRDLPIITP